MLSQAFEKWTHGYVLFISCHSVSQRKSFNLKETEQMHWGGLSIWNLFPAVIFSTFWLNQSCMPYKKQTTVLILLYCWEISLSKVSLLYRPFTAFLWLTYASLALYYRQTKMPRRKPGHVTPVHTSGLLLLPRSQSPSCWFLQKLCNVVKLVLHLFNWRFRCWCC